MLTAKEVDALARKRSFLPDNASLSESLLYHSLVMLYYQYRVGETSKDYAGKEKQRLYDAYEIAAMKERICSEHDRRMLEISKVLLKAEKKGCPLCAEVSRIFDGRQRRAVEDNDKYDI